jgi:uncharacterized protein involved in outer membrane biogenesis
MAVAKTERTRNRTLRRVAWSVAAVVALLLSVLLFALNADQGYLKNEIQDRVSEALGRKFAINGQLHIDLGRMIVIEAGNIELASTEWTQHPNLAELDRLFVEIDAGSLFEGPIVVANLEVSGLRVYAEKRSDGETNWSLISAVEETESETRYRTRMPVRFSAVNVDNNQLEYRNEDAAPLSVHLERLSHAVNDNGKVDVGIRGAINETALNVDLGIDHIDHFIDMRDVGFDLVGNVGEIEFAGDLKLEDLLDPSQPTATFRLSGPNVEYLGDVFHVPVVTTGALDFNFNIRPHGEYLALSLSGAFGEFSVTADGRFDDLRNLQDAELKAQAGGPDASVVAKLLGINDFPADPFQFSTNATLTGRALKLREFVASVGKTEITAEAEFDELPNLDGANATARVVVPELARYDALLGLDGRVDGAFQLDAALTAPPGGGADVDISVDTLGGRLVASGRLYVKEDFAGSSLNTELTFADSSQVFRFLQIEDAPTDKLAVTARISRQPGVVAFNDGQLHFGADELSFSGKLVDASTSGALSAQFELRLADLKKRLVDFSIDGNENVPGGPLAATGSIELLGQTLNIPDFTANFAQSEFRVSGNATIGDGPPGADLRMNASGALLSSLLPENSSYANLNKPYRLSAKLLLDDQRLVVSAIDASLGESKLSGGFNTDIGAAALRLGVNMTASSPNLTVFLPAQDRPANQEVLPLTARIIADLNEDLWRIDTVDMKVGDAKLVFNGVFDKWPDSSRTDLNIALTVPDVSKVGRLVGAELPADSARADFRLSSKQDALRIERFKVTVGESDLNGDGSFVNGPVPRINLALQSGLLDLARYMPAPEEEVEETPPPDGRVIPDTPLPFDKLKLLNANIQIDIAALRLRYQQLRDVTVRASILDGVLRAEKISMVGPNGGLLNAQIGIDARKEAAEVWMRANGDNVEIGLPAETQEDRRALPRYDVKLAFIGNGATPRAIASSLNGYAKLVSGEGRLKFGLMRMFTQDFMFELLNTLNPFHKNDPYTNLQCMVFLATVERGQVHGDPVIVLLTDKLKIVAKSSIDLRTESLDVDINTIAQKGIGISLNDLVNPYIKIGGKLAAPELQFDPESAVLQGGAAVATGGISILALNLKKRFLAEKDPCGKAVADAEKEFAILEQKYGSKRN